MVCQVDVGERGQEVLVVYRGALTTSLRWGRDSVAEGREASLQTVKYLGFDLSLPGL